MSAGSVALESIPKTASRTLLSSIIVVKHILICCSAIALEMLHLSGHKCVRCQIVRAEQSCLGQSVDLATSAMEVQPPRFAAACCLLASDIFE